MPKIEKQTKDILEAKEIWRIFVLDTAQDYGSICFSAGVRQWNIVFSVVHVQFYFLGLLYYFIAGQGSG